MTGFFGKGKNPRPEPEIRDETHVWNANDVRRAAGLLRHVDPPGFVHPTASIGNAPESRDFEGEPLPVDLHPSAKVGPFATIDAGTVRETVIGRRSWIFAHAHIGHDVVIGWDCEISTGAIVGGGCWIDDNVRIGLGAVILPRQVIGDGAVIGAGAVVTKDVPPGAVMVGNPARRLR